LGLKQEGFIDAEQVFSSGLCFVFSKTGTVLVAQIDVGEHQQEVRAVRVSLDLRRLPINAVSFAAKTLAEVICSLVCEANTAIMTIQSDDMPPDHHSDECSDQCDLYARLVEAILAKRRSPQPDSQRRPFVLCAGSFTVPDDFDTPLPDEMIAAFEGA
jgi:hypothetical protein